jgi:hypothetical protein
MAAAKSSYLQLFDNESKDDSYSFLVSNLQAKLSFEDAYTAGTGRPMEFKSKAGYKYYKPDGSTKFDLDARFSSVEADVATNAANPVPAQNTQAIADMQVAYQAKDAQIEAAASAEVTRASQAEAALQTAIDGVDSDYKAADQVLTDAVAAEASSRAAAISAEESRALAAEQSLQQQISSILSNVDPALIDSISELLAHVNAADQNLIQSIAQLQSDHDDLKARFDQLTSE